MMNLFSTNDGLVKDKNGYCLEDWKEDSSNNGLRKRINGNWIDSWYIKQFDGWFDIMFKGII